MPLSLLMLELLFVGTVAFVFEFDLKENKWNKNNETLSFLIKIFVWSMHKENELVYIIYTYLICSFFLFIYFCKHQHLYEMNWGLHNSIARTKYESVIVFRVIVFVVARYQSSLRTVVSIFQQNVKHLFIFQSITKLFNFAHCHWIGNTLNEII